MDNLLYLGGRREMLNIEEVKKILKKFYPNAVPWKIRIWDDVAEEICRLLPQPITDEALREKIILLLSPGMLRSGDALNGKGELLEEDTYLFLTKEYKGVLSDKLATLLQQREEEAREQMRVQAPNLIEEAKEQERERILTLITNKGLKGLLKECEQELDKKCFGKR